MACSFFCEVLVCFSFFSLLVALGRGVVLEEGLLKTVNGVTRGVRVEVTVLKSEGL